MTRERIEKVKKSINIDKMKAMMNQNQHEDKLEPKMRN